MRTWPDKAWVIMNTKSLHHHLEVRFLDGYLFICVTNTCKLYLYRKTVQDELAVYFKFIEFTQECVSGPKPYVVTCLCTSCCLKCTYHTLMFDYIADSDHELIKKT